MTQNTFTPEDWTLYTPVATAVGTLTPGDFNPDRVAEMVNTQLATAGSLIPPVAYLGCGPLDTLIDVALPNPASQQDIDTVLGILNGICTDPTRSQLTEEQEEDADLQAKLDLAKADITLIAGAGGLKEQITTDVTGMDARLLAVADFNALSAADRDRLLRAVLKDTLALINKHLTASVHGARADKFELRYIQKQDE